MADGQASVLYPPQVLLYGLALCALIAAALFAVVHPGTSQEQSLPLTFTRRGEPSGPRRP